VRRLAFTICLLLLAGAAWAAPRLTVDPAGNFYRYWLTPSREGQTIMISRSLDQGINFGLPVPLYRCSSEVNSFDLKFGRDQSCALVIGTSWEVSFALSTDNGRTFAPPLLITGEPASFPAVALDAAGQAHFLFLTREPRRGLTRLCYSAGVSQEPQVVQETADELSDPRLFASPWGLVAVWTKRYQERAETYTAVSLDNGRRFSRPRIIDAAPALSYLAFQGGKWRAYALTPKMTVGDLDFSPPTFPEPLAPAAGTFVRAATLEVRYFQPAADPVITKLELSWQNDFAADRTWSFERLDLPGSGEATYSVPVDLPDGRYYLRLSTFDGLAAGKPSRTVNFSLDRRAPEIKLSAPTGEASDARQVVLRGSLSEKAPLTINGAIVTGEADGSFKYPVTLAPGDNRFVLIATDEAGNTGTLVKKLTYSALKPLLTIKKPQPTDWFKPDSSILFDLTVVDTHNNIPDESEGDVVVAGKTLADKLVYSQADESLSGFIKLPTDLADGSQTALVRLRDSAGNVAEESVQINIDRLPPTLTLASGESAFSGAAPLIKLPVTDAGAGLDPAGTIITVQGVSFETVSSGETILLKPVRPLLAGSYEVTITPRDRIGNTGAVQTFTLVIDDQPPLLLITGSDESSGRCRLEGKVIDQYPDSVKIYNGGRLVDSVKLSGSIFTREIPLMSGNNDLRLEAYDQAGNSCSQSLSVIGNIAARSATVTKLGNAPNPFTAGAGQMLFTYTLSSTISTAELKFYIFDLSGTLIWQKSVVGAGSGNLPWDGTDHFGRIVSRGVYPYTVQASAGGVKELHRGKIIVY
jgi:hypothetical protein